MRSWPAPFVSIALLVAACSAPSPETVSPEGGGTDADAAPQGRAIPVRFQGRYAASPERCALAGDESALELRADHVRFHESGGPVLRASEAGDVLDVQLHVTGEGEAREADYSFRLDAHGASLVDLASGFRRVRCR